MSNFKKNKKKVKKGLSDTISRKKSFKPVVNVKEKISSNPFEVKVNKKKFDILGRKQKEEKGLPGVARQKAIKKRQETLLPMLKDRYKTNKFVDKRLGEGDNTMSLEDKMMARFAAERAKTSSKKAMFSLEETEEEAVLTHRGQSLADIERFDDPRSDEEDEEETGGKLGADITSSHFGGGLLSKKEGPTPIEQLIAESKKRKDERQKLREETADLTDQLDSDFKAVAGLLGGMKRKAEEEDEPQQDAYDVAVKQLKFEARAKPTDKLKTADEVAKEEAERLKRLEEERMRRMNPEAKKKTVDHLSADALDDSYLLPVMRKQIEPEAEEEVEQKGESGIEDDDEGSEEEEGSSEGSEGSDEEDGFSDLASDESDTESRSEEKQKAKKSGKKEKSKIADEEISTALPYVVKVPKTYEDFTDLLSPHPPKDQIILLDRMVRCNHPTLSGENKSKIESLFKFLIQLVHDLGRETEEGPHPTENPCSVLPTVGTIMFEIIGLLPQPCCTALRDVISEHFDEAKGKSGKLPITLDLILFLKLVGLLCPTSDYRHAVTTPAIILVTHLLGNSLVTSYDRIVRGLMLSAILLEYITLSKRYSPELFNFLLGVLVLAAPKKPTSVTAIPHPFRGYGPEASLLVLDNDSSKLTDPVPKMTPSDLRSTQPASDLQKITALHTGVKMMSDSLSLWKDSPSYPELGSWVLEAVERIPIDLYPEEVKKSIIDLKDKASGKTARRKLIHPEKRPKMLKLYEPKFEESYDGRKKMRGNPVKAEEEKLKKQYKREMKGAVREIRRDTAFIARAQLKEQLQKDTERKEKVKRLLGSLAMQEGDFKKLKRGKK